MVIVGVGIAEAITELWKHMGYSGEEGTYVWLHLLCW